MVTQTLSILALVFNCDSFSLLYSLLGIVGIDHVQYVQIVIVFNG